jgi:hypothetical protein
MDDEARESIQSMKVFARKMVRGLKLVSVNNVVYHDKYSGAEAWVGFFFDGNYTVTVIDQYENIFVEAFPAQNHNSPKEVPGWIGSVADWRKIVRSSEFKRTWLKHVLTGDWEVYRVERR